MPAKRKKDAIFETWERVTGGDGKKITYIAWVNEQWTQWADLRGVDISDGVDALTRAQHADFRAWLLERYPMGNARAPRKGKQNGASPKAPVDAAPRLIETPIDELLERLSRARGKTTSLKEAYDRARSAYRDAQQTEAAIIDELLNHRSGGQLSLGASGGTHTATAIAPASRSGGAANVDNVDTGARDGATDRIMQELQRSGGPEDEAPQRTRSRSSTRGARADAVTIEDDGSGPE